MSMSSHEVLNKRVFAHLRRYIAIVRRIGLDSLRVMGIDILPGESPASTSQPHYAVVVLDKGKVKLKVDYVSKTRLLRLIYELKPDLIAIDNLYELAESKSSLINFVRRLPPGIRLVQVTRLHDGRELPLEVLSSMYRLSSQSKLSPLEAAEVAAKLASMGVGSVVKIHQGITRITIARTRTLKAGGMSRDRYLRSTRMEILRLTKRVKEALDRHGFDYDHYYRRTTHGLESSIFIVYAPRDSLRGVVKPIRGVDVKVRISPIEVHKVEFEPLVAKSKSPRGISGRYLIVGIDPGIVTGVAMIDIDGNPIMVFSRRYLPRNEILDMVYEYGIPVLIATDANPPSAMVKKLASTLGVPLFTPPRTLGVAEKEKLVQDYLEKHNYQLRVDDSHQRDALAAALKAYFNFKPKLDQVESKIRDLDLNISIREVKALILQGKSMTEAIREVVRRMKPKEEKQVVEVVDEKIVESLKTKIERQQIYINKLREERDLLLEEVKKLKEKLRQVEQEMERLLSEEGRKLRESRMMATLSARIERLEEVVEKLRKENEKLSEELKKAKDIIMNIASGKYMPLKVMRTMSNEGLKELITTFGIKRDDIVLVVDASHAGEDVLEELRRHRVVILALGSPPRHVLERAKDHGVAVIEIDSKKVSWLFGIPLLRDPEPILKLAERARKEVERYYRRRKAEDLRRIIEEYRKLRAEEEL